MAPVSTTGLSRGHRQMQEVRRFFHGVGAVGDDHAVHIGLFTQRGHAARQQQQALVGEVGRIDLEDLFGLQLRRTRQARHARDQRIHRNHRRLVRRRRRIARPRARAGNGAAGGDQGNARAGGWGACSGAGQLGHAPHCHPVGTARRAPLVQHARRTAPTSRYTAAHSH
jgi:hypothetical protein